MSRRTGNTPFPVLLETTDVDGLAFALHCTYLVPLGEQGKVNIPDVRLFLVRDNLRSLLVLYLSLLDLLMLK